MYLRLQPEIKREANYGVLSHVSKANETNLILPELNIKLKKKLYFRKDIVWQRKTLTLKFLLFLTFKLKLTF